MTNPPQSRPDVTPAPGPIPDDNRPGHHPEHEQDKPTAPPRLAPVHHRFTFRFDPRLALPARAFGVHRGSAWVDVDDDDLEIRFGPWRLRTSIDNVRDAQRTGPYDWWKVIGPARLSLADRGVTFATALDNGVCIAFERPVPAALPFGLLHHPAVTVTVDEPDDLVRLLTR